jgi:serine/threonine protein kinase
MDDYIICYIDSFADNKYSYIVMEYFKGYDLFDVINESGYKPTDMDVTTIAKHIFTALSMMHHLGIVHRDIKLENILFNEKNMKLKVIDVGLACIDECDPFIRVGTKHMFPPEFPPCTTDISNNPISFDGFERADVFAAGLVLYELATSESMDGCPFTKEQIEAAEDGDYEYPEHIEFDKLKNFPITKSIVELCLTPDPEDRPTAQEILDILEEYF